MKQLTWLALSALLLVVMSDGTRIIERARSNN